MSTVKSENLRLVRDAWASLPDCNCFCCGQSHEWGFRLRFFYDPDLDAVISRVPAVKEGMAGWPGVLHGGFQAMLLDEIMCWGVMHFAGKTSFTGKMDVRFIARAKTGVPLLLKTWPVKIARRMAMMKSSLLEEEGGKVLAEGAGSYLIPSLKEFRENFGINDVPEGFAEHLRT